MTAILISSKTVQNLYLLLNTKLSHANLQFSFSIKIIMSRTDSAHDLYFGSASIAQTPDIPRDILRRHFYYGNSPKLGGFKFC